MMDNTLFSTAMMLVDKVIEKVKIEDYNKPTPCTEWNVKELTNHLLYELVWIAPLLEGKTIAEVGQVYEGDLIKGDAGVSWMKYCRQTSAQMAKTKPRSIAHLSYSDKTAQAYVDEVAADLIIHGWDLAQALGLDYKINDLTVSAIKKATDDVMPGARESGYIAEELEVDKNASEQDKLLAYYGRSVNWNK